MTENIPEQTQEVTKKVDERKWYQKKRWLIPIGLVVVSMVSSALTGGNASDEPQAGVESKSASPSTAQVVSLVMPDLIGMNTSDASDDLEVAGFTDVSLQDASQEDRMVLVTTNWYVCETRPEAGTTLDSDRTVVVLSVKNNEVCPGQESAAEPSAEPSASASEPSGMISSGTYLVGSEIQPGFYRVSSYYARLDENQEIIDNDLIVENGWIVVNVLETDKFFKISGVAYPLESMPFLNPIEEGFTQGSYLVGVDLEPGTYRVTASDGDFAYASRLACDADIIDNDLNSGSVILTVLDSDCIFKYTGILERIE